MFTHHARDTRRKTQGFSYEAPCGCRLRAEWSVLRGTGPGSRRGGGRVAAGGGAEPGPRARWATPLMKGPQFYTAALSCQHPIPLHPTTATDSSSEGRPPAKTNEQSMIPSTDLMSGLKFAFVVDHPLRVGGPSLAKDTLSTHSIFIIILMKFTTAKGEPKSC